MTSTYFCFYCKASGDNAETLHGTRFCSVYLDSVRAKIAEQGRENYVQEQLRGWYKGQGEACMCLGDCPACNFHACHGCLCCISNLMEALIEIERRDIPWSS